MPHVYLSKISLKQAKQDGIIQRDFKFTQISFEILTASLAMWP